MVVEKVQPDRCCAGKGRHLDGDRFIRPVLHNYDVEIDRVKTRGGAEQRGDSFHGRRVVDIVGAIIDVEEGQLWYGNLCEGRLESVGSKTAEGELGEVPPEAAPPAGEDAGAGNGGGAAEAEPGGASRSAWSRG